MNEATTTHEVASARIVVVDDEPANLMLADALLRSDGHSDVVLVQDPRDLPARHAEGPVDLIVLDLNMPHTDGYEVMAQLRALGDPLLPPILVLTAQGGHNHLLRALGAGARDFVSKPFDRAELLMRVRNLLDAHRAYRLLHREQGVLKEMVRAGTEQLNRSCLQVVQRLGRAAEYRDEETGNHILRMSHTAAVLARAAGWDEDECDLLLHAAPMHDIGKIGIPDHILLKPGKLDADEWEVMKTHAEIGARILVGADSDLLEMGRQVALTHHEKWDGSGYPQGLSGDAIPQVGRICALADVFDALTSPRPYKKAWTVEAALELIQAQSGRHFDPDLVPLLLAQLPAILAIRERFSDAEPRDLNHPATTAIPTLALRDTNVKSTDLRSLPRTARRDVRAHVVQLRAAGHTYGDIAARTGLSRTGAFDICRRVEASGAAALDDAPSGRRIGDGRTLDAMQDAAIRALVTDQTPDRLSLPYPLWTKAAVTELVHRRLGISLSVRNTALCLARWGFKPHKPMDKAQHRSPMAAKQWLDATYPHIAAQARIEDAEICWADASELRTPEPGRREETTRNEGARLSRTPQAGLGLSVFSTVNNKGQMHWATFAGPLNANTLVECLRRRIQAASKKLF
jgi:putative two-component system response regulator